MESASPADARASAVIPVGGMASMMEEMSKTLARRRAQAENSQSSQDGDKDSLDGKSWNKQSSMNGNSPSKASSGSGAESPKGGRKLRLESLSDSDAMRNGLDGLDVERLKQELMVDIRKEMNKLKLDIIDAIKMELNRR